MIKKIGTEARKDLEAFFDCKVYLDLRVKVKPDWRDDERVLDDLGLPAAEALRQREPRSHEFPMATRLTKPTKRLRDLCDLCGLCAIRRRQAVSAGNFPAPRLNIASRRQTGSDD